MNTTKPIYHDATKALEHICGQINQEDAINQHCMGVLKDFMEKTTMAAEKKVNPFLKLYIYLFTKFTVHYQELPSSRDMISQKEIHRVLKKPLGNLIEELTEEINLILLQRATLAGSVKPKHEYTTGEVSENIKQQATKAFLNYLND